MSPSLLFAPDVSDPFTALPSAPNHLTPGSQYSSSTREVNRINTWLTQQQYPQQRSVPQMHSSMVSTPLALLVIMHNLTVYHSPNRIIVLRITGLSILLLHRDPPTCPITIIPMVRMHGIYQRARYCFQRRLFCLMLHLPGFLSQGSVTLRSCRKAGLSLIHILPYPNSIRRLMTWVTLVKARK
ncbi:hypothetical protein CPB83DRAFT_84472 [Crepidotus variabilis]|uniref:Uncharacterized protein n=1 Tax=Crepidotus variabilis TaxID=179855 RepID=A0A9P6JSX3_9AGAR|nr:hypothetical protein CPB83DRAFT_84472 [Crepidotus variabilis]